MQNAWILIVSSLFLGTAACAGMEPVEGTKTNSANTIDENNSSEDSDLGYGWETKIDDRSVGKHSLHDIVTDPKVRVRADGRSCVGCHSWAEYQDRASFCERVDAFLDMPTATGDKAKDKTNAKPANLKKLLRDWKEAGCPN
jgi:hypothetical protein